MAGVLFPTAVTVALVLGVVGVYSANINVRTKRGYSVKEYGAGGGGGGGGYNGGYNGGYRGGDNRDASINSDSGDCSNDSRSSSGSREIAYNRDIRPYGSNNNNSYNNKGRSFVQTSASASASAHSSNLKNNRLL